MKATKFEIYAGREVGVLPRGNARYYFRAKANEHGVENTPIPAVIESVGKVYFNVRVDGYMQTRFRKDDLTCADKEENRSFVIFESLSACEEYVRKWVEVKEIRDMLNKLVWHEKDMDGLPYEDIHSFLLALKRNKEE